MAKIYTSFTDLIGNTPLLELIHIEQSYQLPAKVLGKIEGTDLEKLLKEYHVI